MQSSGAHARQMDADFDDNSMANNDGLGVHPHHFNSAEAQICEAQAQQQPTRPNVGTHMLNNQRRRQERNMYLAVRPPPPPTANLLHLHSAVRSIQHGTRKDNTKKAYDRKTQEYREFVHCKFSFQDPYRREVVEHEKVYSFMFYCCFRENKVGKKAPKKPKNAPVFDEQEYDQVLARFHNQPRDGPRLEPKHGLKASAIEQYKCAIKQLHQLQQDEQRNTIPWEQIWTLKCTELHNSYHSRSFAAVARLAMGMMSDMWELGNIKGRSPSDWVGKLGQIYSSGLCQPEKGDFGEVLASLYFLLCGDILRHRCDDDLKTFSVDLDLCFDLLMNGGNTDATNTPAAKRPRKDKQSSKTSVTLSCIQFCHNYLHSYETNWSTLGDQQFLRQLYASGTGFFTFAGCPTIDAVFALCIRNGTSEKYIPCLLSIKSHNYFSHDMAQELCHEMKVQAENSNLQALCIVVVFGSSVQSKNDDSTFSSDTYSLLESGETVAVVLRIPLDDVFGISSMNQQLTSNADLMEVYGSHSFIRAHTGKSKSPALDPKVALRAPSFGSNMTPAESLLDTLSEQLRQSPPYNCE